MITNLAVRLLLALPLLAWPSISHAVPSAQRKEVITNADGSTFVGVTKGDEWNNWVENADGFTVSKHADGNWHYVLRYDGRSPVLDATPARAVAPAYLVRHAVPRPSASGRTAAAAQTTPAPSAAPVGSFTGPILFILAEFTNQSGSTTEASWASFITGNIADFYAKVSYGAVSLTAAPESFGTPDNGTVGWVNLGYPHPDPGVNIGTSNEQISRDAIIAADPYVDFAAFDDDHDGYVDADELAIVVIVAGYERAYSGNSPSIWAHRGSISCCGGAPVVDGVVAASSHDDGGYAQFGERHDDHQATMGVMVHELGHLIFDLPDLYDGDYTSPGAGNFSVMSHGTWGAKFSDLYLGMTPVAPDAWVKKDRGWVVAAKGTGVESIVGGGSPGADATNTVFRVPTLSPLEYFLVENRQNTGYDQGVEQLTGGFGGGIAIWHVDEMLGGNGIDTHRLLDLEEANGSDSYGSTTSMYYVGNATAFDDTTTPNSRRYDGSSSGKSVETLTASADSMSVEFSTPLCGNGTIGPGEVCDGVASGACPTGTCGSDCFCPEAICGNEIVEDGENCDVMSDSACPGECGPVGGPAECRCPVPDSCLAARIIAALPYSDSQNIRSATADASDPTTCGFTGSQQSHSVWYTLVAPATGAIAVVTLGSNYATRISVFTGSCGSLSAVGCNNNVPGFAPSHVVFGATVGTSYFIEVSDSGTASGESLVLHVGVPECAATPQVCRTPSARGKAPVALTDESPDDQDQLQWKWSEGAGTAFAYFGDPVHTDAYQLCVYDGGGMRATLTVPPGGLCSGIPCWTAKSTGFRYTDRTNVADGIAQIVLKAGYAGKARIHVKGKGANLPMPSLVSLASPVTVQLKSLSTNDACWGASYSFPLAIKNDGVQFKDKAD